MTYTTPSKVRSLLGLSETQVSDETLSNFIEYSDKIVLSMITVRVIDDELEGNINGSNTKFYTSFKPIADTNLDKTIDASDVTVYGWTKASDPTTKTELTVSSVDSNEGLIILSSAPSSDTYKKITADYSYYLNPVDWSLVELASTLYAGYRYLISETLLIPESWSVGTLRIRMGSRRLYPYIDIYNDFLKIIELIKRGYSYREAERLFPHLISESNIIYGE